jgi:ubiquinone/menaquinone biosynthesis C-methylase UbiE
MVNYSNIAEFYDLGIALPEEGNEGSRYGKFAQKVVREFNIENNAILDLACGTGNFLREVQSDFNFLYGVDLSEEMLKIARLKIATAKFYREDISTFSLDRHFNFITCFYDSINHLLLFDDWEKMFQQVSKHLHSRCFFLFDFNTVERLEVLVGTGLKTEKIAPNLVLNIVVKKEEYYNWHVSVKDEKQRKETSEIISEASFPLSDVKSRLSNYFEIKGIYDTEFKRTDVDAGRLYVLCQKKI